MEKRRFGWFLNVIRLRWHLFGRTSTTPPPAKSPSANSAVRVSSHLKSTCSYLKNELKNMRECNVHEIVVLASVLSVWWGWNLHRLSRRSSYSLIQLLMFRFVAYSSIICPNHCEHKPKSHQFVSERPITSSARCVLSCVVATELPSKTDSSILQCSVTIREW